ncbi:MAG TPA: hypothetical protein VKA36_04705 [Solirubrobacterales bacterium]|nr:hypothetical protein [Solirubrobacterales bacterium]
MALPEPRKGLDRFRYEYGAEPLHLLATLASLGIFAYALLRIFEIPSTGGILLWLGGAIVLHDFIALPLYSAFLRLAEVGAESSPGPRRLALLRLNHVRIPIAFSLLLLLISFPLVFQLDEPRYMLTTGLDLDRFLGNWLLISAALFIGSGIHYALRLRGGRARRPMITRELRRPPAPEPGRGAVMVARGVLVIGLLFALWVAALVVYGLLNSFPL